MYVIDMRWQMKILDLLIKFYLLLYRCKRTVLNRWYIWPVNWFFSATTFVQVPAYTAIVSFFHFASIHFYLLSISIYLYFCRRRAMPISQKSTYWKPWNTENQVQSPSQSPQRHQAFFWLRAVSTFPVDIWLSIATDSTFQCCLCSAYSSARDGTKERRPGEW